MRQITVPADEWDVDERRAAREAQWARDWLRVINVERVPSRPAYLVTLKPVEHR